ncbi:Hypothetical predicted protein [Xyrichtys novacula]|uniref:Uncharacterized protein n=1 Tax=Xyrichtys novacula TaxID=13765 RepID=A0AAV1H3F5_XYRNO|nr:Hypothetical predicted protein [Xyrichtys novacula]
MQASQQLSSTRSISSRLLKLRLCDPSPAAPNQEYQVSTENGRGGKLFISSVESFEHMSCVWTDTATTEENHFGSSCCFMAEYLYKTKKQKLPTLFQKSPKLLPKLMKGKQAVKWPKENQDQASEARPRY